MAEMEERNANRYSVLFNKYATEEDYTPPKGIHIIISTLLIISIIWNEINCVFQKGEILISCLLFLIFLITNYLEIIKRYVLATSYVHISIKNIHSILFSEVK